MTQKPKIESLNQRAAKVFRECADVLSAQKANPFRINAYRRAAGTLETMQEDVQDILDTRGTAALIELPGIGQGLAAAINEIAHTGRLAQLERLRGDTAPERLFQSVPGIGPKLAKEINDALHVDTLEALEMALHDGRLGDVAGIGERRAAAIRAGLAERLGRRRRMPQSGRNLPPVALLLAIDRAYRERAAAGKLPRIAPKRFNPDGIAWLPIIHTDRSEWHFTALFSNTARAHELGRTDDWVVVYFYDDDHREGQCTIVTETRGPRRGERVVRGREDECGSV